MSSIQRLDNGENGSHRSTPAVAFLGPCGTYTHQAAYNRFSTSATYAAKESIAGTYESLSPEIPFAVIPKENSIFGSVVETYDLLRSKDVGRNVFIRDEVTLQVQHCLLVRKGVKLENITRVLSHEQALGQCSQFLNERLPSVKTIKTPSTGYAAAALLEPEYSSNSAAICSKICETLFDGLQVLFEGVQREKSNFTKFWVLATSLDTPLPGEMSGCSSSPGGRAILRLTSLSDSPDLLSAMESLRLFVGRVDRRPSQGETPFRDVYFVEVARRRADHSMGNTSTEKPTEDGEVRWRDIVEAAARRLNAEEWEACVIGVW